MLRAPCRGWSAVPLPHISLLDGDRLKALFERQACLVLPRRCDRSQNRHAAPASLGAHQHSAHWTEHTQTEVKALRRVLAHTFYSRHSTKNMWNYDSKPRLI